ncbi:MAG: 7-cyano-7-deazaguanine synthase QueC [Rhodospirillales bacterium]|nr:7-cyano-7-deazaguanine synthase QueC [Rhodospirillales bacterium]
MPPEHKAAAKAKAVVLLSGGLDSAVSLAIAAAEGFEAHALTVRYGQRHQAEIAAAARVAGQRGVVGHDVVDIDLAAFGGSALTGGAEVPKDRSAADMAAGIPVTYVPARNTVFLALALARAETLGARDIFIGVNALDYSGYPDCRPEYVAAFEALANLATKAGVEATTEGKPRIRLHAPLIALTKAEIVKKGAELGVDFGVTLSCYDPRPARSGGGVRHCGRCDACLLRKKGFAEAGIADPTDYEA